MHKVGTVTPEEGTQYFIFLKGSFNSVSGYYLFSGGVFKSDQEEVNSTILNRLSARIDELPF